MFIVKSSIEEFVLELQLQGILDIAAVDILEDVFNKLDFEEFDTAVFDFAAISMIDSTGIGSLLNLNNLLIEKKIQSKIINLNDDIREIFSIIGVDDLFMLEQNS